MGESSSLCGVTEQASTSECLQGPGPAAGHVAGRANFGQPTCAMSARTYTSSPAGVFTRAQRASHALVHPLPGDACFIAG